MAAAHSKEINLEPSISSDYSYSLDAEVGQKAVPAAEKMIRKALQQLCCRKITYTSMSDECKFKASQNIFAKLQTYNNVFLETNQIDLKLLQQLLAKVFGGI